MMVYYIIFPPHLLPVDGTSLYKFIYKCMHPGIIHRIKIKSKYNAACNAVYNTV